MSVSVNMTSSGAQPTPPSTLRASVLALATAASPGLTANLPSSLVEDMLGTSVGALSLIDQAMVDLVNSLTPNQANEYIVLQQGAQAGIPRGTLNNSSAYILFTGLAGFTVSKGFLVSDGLHQYAVQQSAVLGNATPTAFTVAISGTTMTVSGLTSGQIMIGDTITSANTAANTVVTDFIGGTGGNGTYKVSISQTVTTEAATGVTHGTALIYVVATTFGTWAIPANSITSVATSLPAGYMLTCTNPVSGIVATAQETTDLYRSRINEAGLSPAIGTLAMLKTLLRDVTGVQSRLVSVSGASRIIVGGGDPYAVAAAIFNALFDVGDLQGSTVLSHTWSGTGSISGTTLTLSAVSTGTVQIGDILNANGIANPTIIIRQLTGTPGGAGDYLINYAQTIASEPISGSNSARNVVVDVIDYPDTYSILYVSPPSQSVEIALSWSTISPNFTANAAIESAAIPALVAYINSLTVTSPMNVYAMQKIFLESISAIISSTLISALTFTVKINGTITAPSPGTGLIYGDAEGYFVTDSAKIVLTRV